MNQLEWTLERVGKWSATLPTGWVQTRLVVISDGHLFTWRVDQDGEPTANTGWANSLHEAKMRAEESVTIPA